jgi:hypothetical protein
MSNLLLQQNVASYINSWEGHSDIEGYNFIQLRDKIKNATIEELTTEYNALTQQNLWNASLLDLFYDEFRSRMFNETTFSISVTWRSIENPTALIMVGFEDSYPIIDGDGSFILPNDPKILNNTLTSINFSNEYREAIIRMLLDRNVTVIANKNLQIVGLENPNKQFYFDRNQEEVIKIKTSIREASDWNFYNQIYQALRKAEPAIMDPMEDVLPAVEEPVEIM